jgi:Ca2+-dependent lipid-binding protein
MYFVGVLKIKLSDIFDEKTDIAPKTLNPVWNKDFRIEVPHDGTLRKHPLEFKCVLVEFCSSIRR